MGAPRPSPNDSDEGIGWTSAPNDPVTITRVLGHPARAAEQGQVVFLRSKMLLRRSRLLHHWHSYCANYRARSNPEAVGATREMEHHLPGQDSGSVALPGELFSCLFILL